MKFKYRIHLFKIIDRAFVPGTGASYWVKDFLFFLFALNALHKHSCKFTFFSVLSQENVLLHPRSLLTLGTAFLKALVSTWLWQATQISGIKDLVPRKKSTYYNRFRPSSSARLHLDIEDGKMETVLL